VLSGLIKENNIFFFVVVAVVVVVVVVRSVYKLFFEETKNTYRILVGKPLG
jgi:hypothetical protein